MAVPERALLERSDAPRVVPSLAVPPVKVGVMVTVVAP